MSKNKRTSTVGAMRTPTSGELKNLILTGQEINTILAEDLCADLIVPVQAAYEDEKARILGTAVRANPANNTVGCF